MFYYIFDNQNEEGYKPDNQSSKTPFTEAVENIDRLRQKYPDKNLTIFDRILLEAKEKELIEKRKKSKK